ncbi:MAG: EF-hand domain-containing protein [Kofleriaceae bacterium]
MFHKLKLVLIATALLVGGTAGMALANGGHKQRFDANQDGALDAGERAKMKEAFKAKHAARKQQMLDTYDANRDGSLDGAERTAMQDDRAAKRFAKLDANGDGRVTFEEFKAAKRFGHHGRRGMGRGKL